MGSSTSRRYYWIDAKVFNNENSNIYNECFGENTRLICDRFETVNKGITYIKNNQNNEFQNITIIVSGALYNKFYFELLKILNIIKFSPTIIIFCQTKKYVINKLIFDNLYYNNKLLNHKLIFDKIEEFKEFIKSFKIEKENDFSFELVENFAKLAIPYYHNILFQDITISEIDYFNKYLKEKYGKGKDMTIYNLICQIENKNLPEIIICKYWMHIYTYEKSEKDGSNFYSDMNRDLRECNNNISIYYPFIKMCYKAIRKEYLEPIINKELYRGQKMNKEEFNNLYNLYNNRNNDLQKILIWSKTFLSFSKDINKIEHFIQSNNDNNLVTILFVVEKIENMEVDKNTFSNADINNISFYNESEVLIFPFSCFEVKRIEKGDIIKINLEYLGKYRDEIKNQLKNLEEFNMNIKYSELLISNGIIKSDFVNLIWFEKGRLNINMINIWFLLDKNEDLLGNQKNLIFIFTINGIIKQKIEVFKDDILCIIKLQKKKICSSSKDNTIKIIQLLENNEEYKITKIINLGDSFAKSIIYLMNKNIIILKSNNDIDSYDLNNDNKKKIFKDETNDIMKFNNNDLVYITEQNNIYFLKIIHNQKLFTINFKEKLIQNNQNMICYKNYIFLTFESRINIFKFTDKITKIELYFETIFKITNIININSDKFILGLYNSEENESIIREYVIHENEKENEINLEVLAEGKFEKIMVEKIIVINNSKLILKTQENKFIIIEKISKLKEFFKAKNIIKEDEDKDGNLSIEKKKIEIKVEGKIINYVKKNEIKYEIINVNKKHTNYVKKNEIKIEIINKNNNISIKYKEIIESYDKLIKKKKNKKNDLISKLKSIKNEIDELQLNYLFKEISNKVNDKIGERNKINNEIKILEEEITNLENQKDEIKNSNKSQINAIIKSMLFAENLPISNKKEIKTDNNKDYESNSLNSS